MDGGASLHSEWPLKLLNRHQVTVTQPRPPKQGDRSSMLLSTLDKDSCFPLGHTLAQQEALSPSYLDTALWNSLEPSPCPGPVSFLLFLFISPFLFFFYYPKAKFICKVLKEACPFYAGSPQQRSEIVYFAAKKSPSLYNFNNRKMIFALQCLEAWRKTGCIQVAGALQMSGSPLF